MGERTLKVWEKRFLSSRQDALARPWESPLEVNKLWMFVWCLTWFRAQDRAGSGPFTSWTPKCSVFYSWTMHRCHTLVPYSNWFQLPPHTALCNCPGSTLKHQNNCPGQCLMKNILKLVGRRHHPFLMRFSQGLSTSFQKSLRKSKNICGSVLYGTKEKGGFMVLISLLILGRIAFWLPFQNYLYKHSYDTLATEFVQHLLNGIAFCAVSCRHHLRDFVKRSFCNVFKRKLGCTVFAFMA